MKIDYEYWGYDRISNRKHKIQESDMYSEYENIAISALLNNPSISTETRDLYLIGEVNEQSTGHIISQIHFLEKIDNKKDIRLFINSDGGYMQDCLALINVMDAVQCDISTYTIGRAASAACLIASNGSPGKRYAGANSEFMYHEMYGDVPELKASEFPYYRKEFHRKIKTLNYIFSRNTGKSIPDIKKVFLEEYLDKWMDAKEAKKFGIIDHFMPVKRKSNKIEKPKKAKAKKVKK